MIKKGSASLDSDVIHHHNDDDDYEEEEEEEGDYDRSRRGSRKNDGRILGSRMMSSGVYDVIKTAGGRKEEEGDVELALHRNDDHIRI